MITQTPGSPPPKQYQHPKCKTPPSKPFPKDKKTNQEPQQAPTPMALMQPPSSTLTTTTTPTLCSQKAALLALVETLTCQLTIMETTDLSETTVELTGPQFEHSIFCGATLQLQEFSTAPKVFNVHFIGSPEAAALLGSHAAEIIETLRSETKPFAIHRIDTSLCTKHRIVERKQEKEHGHETP